MFVVSASLRNDLTFSISPISLTKEELEVEEDSSFEEETCSFEEELSSFGIEEETPVFLQPTRRKLKARMEPYLVADFISIA